MKKVTWSLVLSSMLLFTGCQMPSRSVNAPAPEPQVQNQPTPQKQQVTFTYLCQAGQTALDGLYNQVGEANVGIKDFSFGKQVTAINGIEQGEGKYWLYTVDGDEASSSADTYVCHDQEQIEWQLK